MGRVRWTREYSINKIIRESTETKSIIRRYLYEEFLVANSDSIRPSSTLSMAACCQRDERLLALSGNGRMANLQTNS